MEYYSAMKKEGILIWDKTDQSWAHYGKWNKSEDDRQILYDITYV